MADMAITAANVIPVAGYNFTDGVAGETVTAGQLVYLKSSDSKYWLVDNDAAATAGLVGMALNGAAAGQPVRILTGGSVNPGGTVVVGTIYGTSSTAGGLAPSTDFASGDYVSIFGIGTTSSNIAVDIQNSGVAVPT